ncbi:Fructose-1,6-bisphosphatase 2 class 2 [Escherichia coli]|uniref:fructose-bisphosphatase n=1 Tax=Escherichia coli TaxID=562 RepID=A0A2X1KAC2_ECOLX|nr:Fructose-1,6-bisphosphatase 2 class 2 [Escherichia coli]
MMSLAWPLFRVTEQAALAAWPQTGCGDKNKIDGLAVTAMRQAIKRRRFSWTSGYRRRRN